MTCQSVIDPSRAEYWHMGETTTRLGSVMPPRSSGVKSLGRADRDVSFLERFSQCRGEGRGSGLVAVQAERVGGDRHALALEARDVALLDHRERLLHRLGRIRDHAAGLVARRKRAVIRVAAVGEHLAADTNTLLLCDLEILAVRKHVEHRAQI